MPECITIVLSLICLMLANIIMGKKLADFKQEYNKEKLVGGISKAAFFLIGLALTYCSTLIYPMDVAEVNGQMVTTLTGATILIKAANLIYAGKVLMKIKDLLVVNVPINSLTEISENGEK
nr:MAG TPA: hypothetical protein [Caudoviricetes sp.]